MKLKVICTEHPDRDTVIKGEPYGYAKHYLSSVYLDGIVERVNGFDCVDLINTEDFKDFKTDKVVYADIPDGIYDCYVYGYDNDCKAYIWRVNNTILGLICDVNDDIANDSALTKYISKTALI